MAKLYFRYGAMGSSKSANALMTVHNYEEQGRNVVLLKPETDTRWEDGMVTSRAGDLKHSCFILHKNSDINNVLEYMEYIGEGKAIEAVVIDECQFLTKKQVVELAHVVDEKDIAVICYGLKNSAIDGKLFEGSEALLYYADSIEELKTLCHFCKRKATMNLRLKNGKPVYAGDMVVIGDIAGGNNADEEVYLPTCRKHYFKPVE